MAPIWVVKEFSSIFFEILSHLLLDLQSHSDHHSKFIGIRLAEMVSRQFGGISTKVWNTIHKSLEDKEICSYGKRHACNVKEFLKNNPLIFPKNNTMNNKMNFITLTHKMTKFTLWDNTDQERICRADPNFQPRRVDGNFSHENLTEMNKNMNKREAKKGNKSLLHKSARNSMPMQQMQSQSVGEPYAKMGRKRSRQDNASLEDFDPQRVMSDIPASIGQANFSHFVAQMNAMLDNGSGEEVFNGESLYGEWKNFVEDYNKQFDKDCRPKYIWEVYTEKCEKKWKNKEMVNQFIMYLWKESKRFFHDNWSQIYSVLEPQAQKEEAKSKLEEPMEE
jgi:hypothetical protein